MSAIEIILAALFLVLFVVLLIVALLQRNAINDQKRMLDLYKQRNAFLNENIVVVKKQSK